MAAGVGNGKMHLAVNQYSLATGWAREGRAFGSDLAADLRAIRDIGLDGFEPILNSPEEADRYGAVAAQAGIAMRSVYVNTTLHRADAAEASIASVLAIAERARTHGARIVVTNPNPVSWGGSEDKSDAELQVQAAALDRLGKALAGMGLQLAYHNHDAELRRSAREFHHMMCGTDPRWVKLCLDSHWIYRGCGNSQVALLDILKLYGPRIVEMHLRQSQSGTWSEAFGAGDLDYAVVAGLVRSARVHPHMVLEQAPEPGTPRTMDTAAALSAGAAYAHRLFESIGRS